MPHIFFARLAERLENATMIIASHRFDDGLVLVNRVLEMGSGRIVLDDRVAEDQKISALFQVPLTLARADAAMASSGTVGTVSGPDRLRFMGMVSRYVGLLSRIEMKEVDPAVTLQ